MANLREIKSRIKTVGEMKKITKAMKLIAAAKLKKARQMLDQTLPYFDKVKVTMADILIHSGNISNPFFETRTDKESRKKGFIIMTGDKGLAGGYNHNLIKFAEKYIKESPDSLLFVAGLMGRNYFSKKKYNVVEDFDYPVQNPTVYRAREISEVVLEKFIKGELDEVYVVYTNMITTLRLEPAIMKLLPLDLNALKEELKGFEGKVDEALTYEPSPNAVFDVLIPKYVKGIAYGAFVEAFTSEQSARMTAMDSATSNADDMLQRLNLYYNRARQAAITQEISEIVGGAEALVK